MLWFDADSDETANLDHRSILQAYAYPQIQEGTWLRSNFVAAINGATSVDGKSGQLGSDPDKAVFTALRELADAVIVGAGTAQAESYGGVNLDEDQKVRRETNGQLEVPPVVVISNSGRLDPAAGVFTDTIARTLIVVPDSKHESVSNVFSESSVDVIAAGQDSVDLTQAIEQIQKVTGPNLLCEGGPKLHSDLLAADLLDELCLTISPVLTGQGEGSIIDTSLDEAATMHLAGVIHSQSTLLLRYLTGRGTRRS